MKYRLKPKIVEAVQWFKNGDHPLDDVMRPFEDTGVIPLVPREGKIVRYYRHPSLNAGGKCTCCGHIMHDHGFLDVPVISGVKGYAAGIRVCPGDWVVTSEGVFDVMPPETFAARYEPVETPSDLPDPAVTAPKFDTLTDGYDPAKIKPAE